MENYKLMNKAVWIEKYGVLVIADLHIGYEESMEVAIPRQQYKTIIQELGEIIGGINDNRVNDNTNLKHRGNNCSVGEGNLINTRKTINKQKENNYNNAQGLVANSEKTNRIKEIIILGDLKHEHGKILDQEWLEVSNLLDYLSGFGKIILIKGNHDKILEPIATRKNIEIKDFYIKNEFGFSHGDKNFREIFDSGIKTIFLGHLHPSISIREDVKKEIYKCFLVGKFKGKEIVILPSFFPLVEGVDVIKEDNNLALDLNLDNFEVFIPTKDETLDFGKVKNVGKLV